MDTVPSNARLAFYFTPGFKTFQLIVLPEDGKSGNVAAAVVLADLVANDTNSNGKNRPVFPDSDSFSDTGIIHYGFQVFPGDKLIIGEYRAGQITIKQ